MRIIWSPLSVDRMSEIAEYITQDNPRTAERWIDEIFAKVEQLKPFPEMDLIVPETNHRKVREPIYSHYRIVYRIEQEQISVLTIRHGKQILPSDDIPA
jgi:toxin ParE1/3/4